MQATEAIKVVDRAVDVHNWHLFEVADFLLVTPEAIRRWRDGRTVKVTRPVVRMIEMLDKKCSATEKRRARRRADRKSKKARR